MGKALAAWMLMAGIAAPAAGPRETLETATARVIDVLQESGSGGRLAVDRRDEIRRTARDLFDVPEVARRALSRHWTGRSPEEQTEFVALFTNVLEGSYLPRLEAYAGEKILYTGEAVDGTYATVRSRLIMRRSELAVDYRLHLRDRRWQVYDVLIDGASVVSTLRLRLDRVIRADSYGALVERLRRRGLAATHLSQVPDGADAR